MMTLEELRFLSNDELATLAEAIQQEKDKRDNEYFNQLYDNLKEAIFAIWDAGYSIQYDDYNTVTVIEDVDNITLTGCSNS